MAEWILGAMQEKISTIQMVLRDHSIKLDEMHRDLAVVRQTLLAAAKSEYTAPPKLQLSWPKIVTVVAKQAVSVAIMASMIRNDADLSTILQQAYGLL